jgi:hypothetical protein
MSGINVDFTIKNQKGTPAFYSDIFANRPSYGYPGRVFISTDTGAIYEDTGTSWTLIADAGAGTTGTLQQVTTNGKTTDQGINITAGGLTLGTSSGDNQTLLNLPANNTLIYRENVGSLYGFNIGASDNSLFLTNTEGAYYQTLYFGDGITTNIFGISASNDSGANWNPVLVVNQDNKVGINTNAPGVNLDVHGTNNIIVQLENETTNNTLIGFRNQGVGYWQIGNLYNAGANSFQIYDVTNSTSRLTILNTGATTLTGTFTATSLIKSGGTSTQYLKADGSTSTLTNPVTGTGTTNYLPKFTGASTIGNSVIQDNGSSVSIGSNPTAYASSLLVYATGNQTDEISAVSIGDVTNNTMRMYFGVNNTNTYTYIGSILSGQSYKPLVLQPNGGELNINTTTSGTGKLNVYSATSDNHIVAIGATAPSIRIDNSVTSATKRVGFGLSTTSNNFIQGSVDRDMCIYNQSTTPSPILFGVYNSGLGYTPEAMRVSSLNNLLVGSPTDDTTNKLQVTGNIKSTTRIQSPNYYSINNTATIPALGTATILTLDSSAVGLYIIQANFGGQGSSAYGSALIVVANAGSFRIVTNGSGASAALTLSGANVQITNALGVSLDALATAILINNL